MELHELMGKLHKLELVQQLAHRRGAQEHGLYFGQMPVLDFIAANPGCTQVQVADHLRVSPASIGALYKAFAEGRGISQKKWMPKTYAASGFISQKKGKGPVPCAASG